MTRLRRLIFALPTLAVASPAMAYNLSRNYLVTITAHPSALDGQQICFTLNQDGSILNYKNSGSWTAIGASGYFVLVGGRQLQLFGSFSGIFVDFSGSIGQGSVISGTSFVIASDQSGQAAVAGTFSAVKGCPQPSPDYPGAAAPGAWSR